VALELAKDRTRLHVRRGKVTQKFFRLDICEHELVVPFYGSMGKNCTRRDPIEVVFKSL
jgi:hypothetical protein